MFSSEAKNIFDVIKPIHFCSKFAGLTSFSIRQEDCHRYRGAVSLYSVLCIIATTFWNVFSLFCVFADNSIWSLNPTFLTIFFEKCLVIVIAFDLFVIIGVNFWTFLIKDRIVAILDEIKRVDETLMDMNINIDHSFHRKIVLSSMIATKVTNISGALFSFINAQFTNVYQTNLLMAFADFTGTDHFTVFSLQCIFLLLGIRLRYQKLNCELEEQAHEVNSPKLAEVHDKLVEITQSLSFCYGIPVKLR